MQASRKFANLSVGIPIEKGIRESKNRDTEGGTGNSMRGHFYFG